MTEDAIEVKKQFKALDLVEQIELQEENQRLWEENAELWAALVASQKQGANR